MTPTGVWNFLNLDTSQVGLWVCSVSHDAWGRFCNFAAYSVTAWDGISDSKGHAFARVRLLRFGGVSAKHGSDLGELKDMRYREVLILSNVTLLGLPVLLVLWLLGLLLPADQEWVWLYHLKIFGPPNQTRFIFGCSVVLWLLEYIKCIPILWGLKYTALNHKFRNLNVLSSQTTKLF